MRDTGGVSQDQPAPLRLALAQVRLVVGDLAANSATVRRYARSARDAGADVVVFPELALTGYPPEDLVLRNNFVETTCAATTALAESLAADDCGELAVIVGSLGRNSHGAPQNTAEILYGGTVVGRTAKMFLPNYGVFDEVRYFAPDDDLLVLRVAGADLALTICEDIWRAGGRAAAARTAAVDAVICINGSPFERGKDAFRRVLCADRAAEAGAPIAYVNQVGGQDELVFDGGSIVVAPDGTLLARAAHFEEDLLVIDLPLGRAPQFASADAPIPIRRVEVPKTPVPQRVRHESRIEPDLDPLAQMYTAIVVGTRDYVEKNGFASVALGLSGGIDSALTATIAVDALGAARVHTVAMPSSYSSQHSLDDAEDLAQRQGTQHRVVEIKPMVEAYQDVLRLTGLPEENLQSRVRGTLLMALSNAEGHLILTTGNKSEIATGFSTLYGDSAGGFAPLKDVPKTLVWELARWRNEEALSGGDIEPIPPNSIAKPPSAELAPGQLDEDRLPPYPLLDALLQAYVEQDRGRDDLTEAGYDPEVVTKVTRLVDVSEYKRRQYAPGPKISAKAFGRDRRVPITNHWREG